MQIPEYTKKDFLEKGTTRCDSRQRLHARKVSPEDRPRATSFSHCLTGQAEWEIKDAYALLDALCLPHEDLPRYFPLGGKAERKLRDAG